MADMAEIDIKEEAKKILSEVEFVQRLQELVTVPVAQLVER